MMEVLQFIFQDFTHWLGTVILIGVVGQSLTYIIAVARHR